MDAETAVRSAREKIASSRRLVILTGAGVSAESGVPTFRGAGATWRGMPFSQLSSATMVDENLPLVWEWFDYRRGVLKECAPNDAHRSIAAAQASGDFDEVTLITQNIDGLHRDAGSEDLVELHGHINTARCVSCGNLESIPGTPEEERPPICPACGDSMRPHVVLFGEGLNEDDLLRAYEAAARCDVCLVIGTSAVVYPANMIPHIAKREGAFVIEVNPEETELTPSCDLSLRGTAVEIVPNLLKSARTLDDPGAGQALKRHMVTVQELAG